MGSEHAIPEDLQKLHAARRYLSDNVSFTICKLIERIAALEAQMKLEKEKYCCSSCAQKRRCHVCSNETEFACSDCQIDLGVTVYVCNKSVCRDAHESKCPNSLKAQVATLSKPVSDSECGYCGGTGEICLSSTSYGPCPECIAARLKVQP